MNRLNPKGIHEWNGDSTHLPPHGELFTYKGAVYYWEPCPCDEESCNRPSGFNEEGSTALGLTVLLRGDDTGFVDVELALKIGASLDEIVPAQDDGTMPDLVIRYMKQNPIAKGLITKEELDELVFELDMEIFGRPGALSLMIMLSSSENDWLSSFPHDDLPGSNNFYFN